MLFLHIINNTKVLQYIIKMNLNDADVLKMINRLIASDRLKKKQILHIINLVSISKSIEELKDNIKWETFNSNTNKI